MKAATSFSITMDERVYITASGCAIEFRRIRFDHPQYRDDLIRLELFHRQDRSSSQAIFFLISPGTKIHEQGSALLPENHCQVMVSSE
jgi:hypothetical protein